MSPISSLDRNVINSVARIAPEKFEQLEELRLFHDPCAIFTNDNGFKFRVDTRKKEIKLPTAALEYLWCACYAFYVIYQDYCKANNSGSNTFDLKHNPASSMAMKLYKWGYDQLNNKNRSDWPKDYPMPSAHSGCQSENCLVADELYLCAIAWILHHEFAHIYHAHPNKPLNDEDSRKQEKEADVSATRWVLNEISDDTILQKRGLGVAIATLVITSQNILLGEFKETTHPLSFQRLYDALTSYFKDEDHLVYAFSTIICHLHMTLAEIEITIDADQTWKQNLESCLINLSRLTNA